MHSGRGVLVLVLAAASLIARPVQATPSLCDAVAGNLVTNCGFEGGTNSSTLGGNTNNGVPVGWTPNAGFDAESGFNHVTNSPVNSGNFALSIGNFDNQPAPTLSQNLIDMNGTSYKVTLFVDYGGGVGSDPGAFFDAQINTVDKLSLNDTALNSYVEYTFSFMGTGSDTLTLTGNTNPSEWFVDDIVVTSSTATAVPEPSSMAILAAGLTGVGFLRRRKKWSK